MVKSQFGRARVFLKTICEQAVDVLDGDEGVEKKYVILVLSN